ncbi:VWA domain-containing protein [Marinobacter lacisalsi]|uniref:VWA domain-containing protein n=1 Tax=Marinobacter lacisalsi TaxID=475979 RepID=A0ABV8QJT9_9GAMM
MKSNKLVAALTLCGAIFAAPLSAAPILSDIVFVVDESGSMGTVQQNLRNNIGLFASILTGTGQVNANYGLVGYGDYNAAPRMVTDLTDVSSFSTAAGSLTAGGSREPGYTATAFALNALDGQSDLFSFRSNAVKNIIILTDEPHDSYNSSSYGTIDGSAVDEAAADGALDDNNALYNGVLSGTSTTYSYETLITDHGGSVFDLTAFNTTDQDTIEDFVTYFANAKLKETLDFCDLNPTDPACNGSSNPVAEPSAFALLGLGLSGLVAIRRRKAAAA